MADDTDFKMLSCFGGPIPTPHIDSLFRNGISFSNAHVVSPICTPSRYSMLTGQYPARCDDPVFLRENFYSEPCMVEHNVYLNPGLPSLGRELGRAGYRTGFVGKWHTGHGLPMLPLPKIGRDDDPDDPAVRAKLQETQQYFDDRVRNDAGFDYAGAIIWGNCEFYPIRKLQTHHLEWTAQKAFDFLEQQQQGHPFFLWFASSIIHGPGIGDAMLADPALTPVGRETKHLGAMPSRASVVERVQDAGYKPTHEALGSIWLDDQVGALLKKLSSLGQLENTLFIFISDNNVEPAKSTCYRAGTHVPMIAQWPAAISSGRVCSLAVSSVDLMPTLLEVAGVSSSQGSSRDGFSFASAFKGSETATTARRELFFEMGYTRAIEVDGWKYIAYRLPKTLVDQMKRGDLKLAPNYSNRPSHPQSVIASLSFENYFEPDQLYHLETDPGELNNLARNPEYSQKLDEMKAKLRRHLETFRHPFDLEDTAFLDSSEFAECIRAYKEHAVKQLPPWWPPQGYQKLP